MDFLNQRMDWRQTGVTSETSPTVYYGNKGFDDESNAEKAACYDEV